MHDGLVRWLLLVHALMMAMLLADSSGAACRGRFCRKSGSTCRVVCECALRHLPTCRPHTPKLAANNRKTANNSKKLALTVDAGTDEDNDVAVFLLAAQFGVEAQLHKPEPSSSRLPQNGCCSPTPFPSLSKPTRVTERAPNTASGIPAVAAAITSAVSAAAAAGTPGGTAVLN
ncbi:hypothetical protein VOLCADRAFT_106751 [Volvox carteri f. nagariensis]|uniref:Pherophorin domain-containing protein n=1 Tax=Volvox carteri f. nagariensis TaxID=3068 RepID=D8U9I6_VOLCA|nr:uncharacterized protein VOLCADRAFT_106751 [Volvox carteri f. nagariensis]EFJ43647.1 hypothetical protein VOLCADRAFT_106751 [Volvox carteri f. nagariensis]|eukprot:XP_002955347.1 hypothetical protein VOLCADRAFT_106751 [Volvox carteri f. nagariensis]